MRIKPLNQQHQYIYHDLCSLCIYADWSWIPKYKSYGNTSFVARYELGKWCTAPKTIKNLFAHIKRHVFVDHIKTMCSKFANASLFGLYPYINNYEEVINNMPKLNVQTGADPPQEGHIYKIIDIEDTVTERNSYPAIKVSYIETSVKGEPILDDGKEIEATSMLWKSDFVGKSGKLGSHISAMQDFLKDEDAGLDTDNWKGKIVQFVSWKDRNREIKVLN
jgi:hypothetical protein